MNRSASASAERALPCLNSNNCIETANSGEIKQLPSQYENRNPTMPNKPKDDQPPQENTAYEDPDIPTQTVDLDFKPADIFSVDGVCPEQRTVDFGMFGQYEFSYQPLCDFASRIRPILILITIVSCSFFVYSSLKD